MRAPLAATLLLGLSTAPTAHAQTTLHAWQGSQPGEQHGYSVANAGDVDGDGFDDIIVGSPLYDRPGFPRSVADAGRITVRSGASGVLLFAVTGAAAGHRLGFDVDGAGDVDGDGLADVVVGVPGKGTGSVSVFFGPDGIASVDINSSSYLTQSFGWSVAGCGDANNDGHDDIVIGSPFESNNSLLPDTGMVYVFDVHNRQSIGYAAGGQSHAHLGWSVDAAGDVDGDGAPDVIAGEPHFDTLNPPMPDTGRALVLSPASTKMQVLMTITAGQVGDGEFGYSVAGGGLIDADGVLDFVVGAPGRDGDTGRVFVLSGATGSYFRVIRGSNAGERFGAAVAAGSDFDRDGRLDFVAGAPSYDVGLQLNRGRIEVRTALTGALLHQATALGGGQIGYAVDIGAHTDIDGRAEVLYGAPRNDTAATNAGASWVVSSSSSLAALSQYGSGLPGTLGMPSLDGSGTPSIGTVMGIAMGSSAVAPAPSVLAVGTAPLSQPFAGGTLLVLPSVQMSMCLAPGTTTIPLHVPLDPLLLGTNFYMQLWQVDAGATSGASHSRGLRITVGE